MSIANVLITEDNVDLRIELTDFLEFNGYPTQAVDTLASMNEKLSTDQFDFLVLDFGLPDGDGLAAIPSIRKRFGRSLGIIALTARGQPKERVAGLEAGADYYLVKPTYLPELKAVLEHLQSYIEKPTIDWVLNLSQQQLMSPNGQLTTLTGTEVLLLQMLSKSDSMVDREQLSSSIFHVSVGDTRRLDTLVCRLRNKVVKKTGLSLPLTTYRNKGYQLGAMMIQE